MLGTMLSFMIILLALTVVLHRDFLASLIAYSLVGLSFVMLAVLARAPDVALSAIAVGGIVIGLFIFAYEKVREEGIELPLGLAVVPLAIALLRLRVSVNPGSYYHYIKAWSIGNLVSEILAGWRLYDSVGEALILFSAALGFSLLIRGKKK
ncbi:hydrogenase subunit MbhD domain-containing protein [Pyrococcus abyssi]|uniref:Multisubunit Na+/H+ antiporter MnhB subunit, putative n=1 Tax=Pyrococcus abyssi (strain GE5 / Orsay) TaxID=272844 RepID=Q9UZE3_PYRAB|nr:hydrogenase subunit MbhD domain-containing protein [Pyrococcus abyssi]CAB50116.1 Multisubunit Na+/H+ antiporter MnhB subunit, putative [Pyrococcus abyssi GE5]CCE70640.1 TPA: putative monovalent cation/H+ antiporter subunit B [Pyrococcus abyssi GE5]